VVLLKVNKQALPSASIVPLPQEADFLDAVEAVIEESRESSNGSVETE